MRNGFKDLFSTDEPLKPLLGKPFAPSKYKLLAVVLVACSLLISCKDSTPKSTKAAAENPKTEEKMLQSSAQMSGEQVHKGATSTQGAANHTRAASNARVQESQEEDSDSAGMPVFSNDGEPTGILAQVEIKTLVEAARKEDPGDVGVPVFSNDGEPVGTFTPAEISDFQKAAQNPDLGGAGVPVFGNDGKPAGFFTQAEIKTLVETAQQEDSSDAGVPVFGNDGKPAGFLTQAEIQTLVEASQETPSDSPPVVPEAPQAAN